VFGGLLALTADDHPLFGAGWVESAAETARPYGTAVTDGWVTFGQATTQVLGRIETFAVWPLMALTLLWLASRNQTLYLRGALALFAANAAGLVGLASLQGFSAHETSLVHDYLALPGVRAGWYLLMALAVVANTTRFWARAAATVIALSAGMGAVLTTDQHLLAASLAVGAPLLAWYGVATLQYGQPVGRRRAVAASRVPLPEGVVLPLRPRVEAPEEWAGSGTVPLRQAG
jgi:hypothetical protein